MLSGALPPASLVVVVAAAAGGAAEAAPAAAKWMVSRVIEERTQGVFCNDETRAALVLQIAPGIHVTFEGDAKGEAPIDETCVAPGLRTLALDNDDVGLHVEREVLFEPGQTTHLTLEWRNTWGDVLAAQSHLRPAPPTEGHGYLSVRTVPWTNVALDGEHIGSSTFVGIRVPAGRHVLTFTNRELSLREERVVVISPGATRVVQIELDMSTAAQAERLARAPPPPPPPPSPRPAPRAMAQIQIGTKPFAQAIIDGKPYGSTPFYSARKLELTIGKHEIAFVDERANKRYRYDLWISGAHPDNKVILTLDDNCARVTGDVTIALPGTGKPLGCAPPAPVVPGPRSERVVKALLQQLASAVSEQCDAEGGELRSRVAAEWLLDKSGASAQVQLTLPPLPESASPREHAMFDELGPLDDATRDCIARAIAGRAPLGEATDDVSVRAAFWIRRAAPRP